MNDVIEAPKGGADSELAATRRMMGRTGRNALWLALSFVSQIISQVFIFSIVGRLGGVEAAGILSYIFAFTEPFQVIMDFGTTRLLVPEIARHREKADEILGNALTLGILVGIPALLVLFAVSLWPSLRHNNLTVVGLYVGGVSMLLYTLALSIRSALRAFNRFDLEAANSVLMAVLQVGGTLVVYLVKLPFVSDPLLALFWVYLGTYLFALVNCWLLYNRHIGRARLRYDKELFRNQILGKTWVFMLINLLFRTYMRGDIIILQFFHGPAAVGYYGIVTALFYRLDLITRLLMTSVLPNMTRAYVKQSENVVGTQTNLFVRLQVLAVLPVTAGGILLAHQIIRLLYGNNFEPSILILQLLMVVLPLRFINRTFTITLTAMDMQTRSMIALAIATLFSLVSKAIFIPQYSMMAATVLSMISEVVLSIIMYVVLTQPIKSSLDWKGLLRPTASLLIVVPILYLVRDVTIFVTLPLTFVIYGLALLVVRAFTPIEANGLAGVIKALRFLPKPFRLRLATLVQARAHG
ncbi:MAG: flippase [Chloroflexota bacterium]